MSELYPKTTSGNVINLVDFIYPIGSVITNALASFDPNEKYPGTTWVRIKGKVIVGVNEAETEFATTGKTGGIKKTVHATYRPPINSQLATDAGGKYHGALLTWLRDTLKPHGATNIGDAVTVKNVGGTIRTDGDNPVEVGYIQYEYTNLQPYVTKYVWERTA